MKDEGQTASERLALEAVDEATYQAARPLLGEALEFTLAAGLTVQDWAEFCLEKFGALAFPHLQRLLDEIRAQSIRMEGWTNAAQGTLFGAPLAADDRDQWVREAAYFRAERRGFLGGSQEEDWAEAECDVARLEASHVGLVGRGKGTALALGEVAARGFGEIRESLGRWLERRPPAGVDSNE